MEHYDVIIIGGGPAGVTCAISARNTYPNKKIVLIRKESKPMIPCGIPYTLNTLNSVDDNILPDTPLINATVGIIEEKVIDISRIEKKLELKNGKLLSFEKLVFATGSKPVLPKIKGIEKEGIYLVKKDRDYLVELRKKSSQAENILIVGGGYIGVEIADELLKAGKKVTIVEKMDCLLPATMDEEFGMKAKEIIEELGGKVILKRGVGMFTGSKHIDGAILDDGEQVSTDIAIVSVGYLPNIKLAEKFGIDFDEKKGILVDDYLRTSFENVFAIGDCAAKSDFFTGSPSNVMLASTAMAEGRLVGSDLFSIKIIRKYQGVLGSFSTKIGNIAFGVSGINEKRAKEKGLDYT
ncbi:MAG: NAD(P)/FAD-dependent oxidoreductase, partial [Ignavibacteria bacterium]